MPAPPSRILVCGGRDYNNYPHVELVLNQLRKYFAEKFCIIQGGAKGADKMAKEWAINYGIPCIQVDANWDRFGKSAGNIRNKWMITFCLPELVIHFPGRYGTKDMVLGAELYKIPTYKAPPYEVEPCEIKLNEK